MSQDLISDCMNQVMNAKKAGKPEVEVYRYSKFLIDILKIAKKYNYIDYNVDEKNRKLRIKFLELTNCRTIKPRFFVKKDILEKYARRFLPAKDFGIMIVSTSKGLMTHIEAEDRGIGGTLIAYFY